MACLLTLPAAPATAQDASLQHALPHDAIAQDGPVQDVPRQTETVQAVSSGSPASALTSYRYALTFTLGLPPGWRVQDDAGFARLIAFSPADSLGDAFRENVNVSVEGLMSDSLDAYWAGNRAAISESMTEFEEREAGHAEIAGLPARRIVYEHTFEGLRLRVLTYLVFAPDRAYFLTATAPVQSYGDYGQTFERILNSFQPTR